MNLLLSMLVVITISTSLGQDLSSPTIDTSSSLQTSSGIGGGAEAQVFRDRFTESPELPGPSSPPFNGTNSQESDTGSSVGSSSVGISSSTDNAPDSISSSDDLTHSVSSGGEDNSIEYEPTSSNGLDGSDSGSVIFPHDDTSDTFSLDAASDAITITFCVSYSLAIIIATTLTLVLV